MNKFFTATLVCTLAACTTTDPYTGESKTNNTSAGAIIGAVAGAAVGVASSSKKDRGKGALTGAVAGGAIGGGVGYYMDTQETELRQQLQGSGVQVQRNGDNINLIMPGNITFETGKYNIRPQFYDVLNSVAVVLTEFNKTAVNIGGHTDSTGSNDFNQLLSERRAQSVRDYLGERKVVYSRMKATGYGPRYPIASNSNSAGREQNRRVEIQLSPL
ncbi:OmpA family protein [Gilvimarinus polysaccharolyticus]|uniref:OmpA family protein n=1 Tax=Gilvimarinus polysaccharolyticus TaxID=863921 RepID=UPI0006738EB0|nr:OmpA family protein [Gilvimarinus polysaccharolyticus]